MNEIKPRPAAPYKPPHEHLMPFGRHKGKTLDQVPASYLRWLLATDTKLSPGFRNAMREQLDRGQPGAPGMTTTTVSCDRCHRPIVTDRHLLAVQSGTLRDRLPTIDLCQACFAGLLDTFAATKAEPVAEAASR